MMRGDVIGGAVVPLTDALPWSFIITDNNNNNNNKCNSSTTTGSNRNGSRTILINDAMDTDGRFLLYTIVSQILTPPTSSPKARATTHHNNSSSNHGNKTGSATKSTLKNNGRVLWLGCGSVTEGQILTGLKKMGIDKTILSNASYQTTATTTTDHHHQQQQEQEQASWLTICSLTTELSKQVLVCQKDEHTKENDFNDNDEHNFLQSMYQYIQNWLTLQSNNHNSINDDNNNDHDHDHPNLSPPSPQWIVLDDVSTLANLLGERRVYQFILAIKATTIMLQQQQQQQQQQQVGLIIRCANDFESESISTMTGGGPTTTTVTTKEWFGAGGGGGGGNSATTSTTTTTTGTNNSIDNNNNNNNHNHNDYYNCGYFWERSLVELVDIIFDVLPLTSGYTRELHGRIIITITTNTSTSTNTNTNTNKTSVTKQSWKNNNDTNDSSSSSSSPDDAVVTANNHRTGTNASSSSSSLLPPVQVINYCITDQQQIVAYII